MALSDVFAMDWSHLPFDLILSIVRYLSPQKILDLCIYNDSFNRRVCSTENQNSFIWKLLYQRDISNDVPSDHVASRYLDIMDEILPLDSNDRLFYGAQHGYNELVKATLQNGANIHDVNDVPLRVAVRNGYTETVKLLLDRGADIHALNDAALSLAAENGHTETVKLLLDRGARIHAFNDNALYWAAEYGNTETVKVLLAHGATITPEIREMAGKSGNPEIIALLK